MHQWHRILGHRDINAVKNLVKMRDLKYSECSCEPLRDVCQEGKMTRKRFAKTRPAQSKAILDLVHSDLCGPIQTQTPSGKKYILTLIDDFSRYTFIYLLREKSEVKEKIMEFVQLMKTSLNRKSSILTVEEST